MSHWKRRAALWMARSRSTRLGQLIGSSAVGLAKAFENDNGDSSTNGEFRVLDRLSTARIETVFDVGAHHGEWSLRAARKFAEATVHAFEIESSTRKELERRVRSESRIQIAPCGLAESSGETWVYVDERYPMTASMAEWDTEQRSKVACTTESGDAYLATHGIDCVDLLKIDVEGLDLSVLRGFSNAISEGRVGFVQFEFTLWAAITNTQLKDFYDLLGPVGYSIGKIYPTYIDWRPYKPEQEIYVRANFAAVHESRPDLIARLVSDH